MVLLARLSSDAASTAISSLRNTLYKLRPLLFLHN